MRERVEAEGLQALVVDVATGQALPMDMIFPEKKLRRPPARGGKSWRVRPRGKRLLL